VLVRFVPVVRTFATVMAGASRIAGLVDGSVVAEDLPQQPAAVGTPGQRHVPPGDVPVDHRRDAAGVERHVAVHDLQRGPCQVWRYVAPDRLVQSMDRWVFDTTRSVDSRAATASGSSSGAVAVSGANSPAWPSMDPHRTSHPREQSALWHAGHGGQERGSHVGWHRRGSWTVAATTQPLRSAVGSGIAALAGAAPRLLRR
jgi:hypothetical protein